MRIGVVIFLYIQSHTMQQLDSEENKEKMKAYIVQVIKEGIDLCSFQRIEAPFPDFRPENLAQWADAIKILGKLECILACNLIDDPDIHPAIEEARVAMENIKNRRQDIFMLQFKSQKLLGALEANIKIYNDSLISTSRF